MKELENLIKSVKDHETYTDAYIFLIEQIEKVNLELERLNIEYSKKMGELIISEKISDNKMEYVLLTKDDAFILKNKIVEFNVLKRTLNFYIDLLEGKKQFLLKEKYNEYC